MTYLAFKGWHRRKHQSRIGVWFYDFVAGLADKNVPYADSLNTWLYYHTDWSD